MASVPNQSGIASISETPAQPKEILISDSGMDWIADRLHDLRTPLVALRGYLRMVLEQRVGPLNNVQQEYLQVVLDSADRMVQQLNEFSSQLQADSTEPSGTLKQEGSNE